MNSAVNLEQARFNMIEQQIRTWDVLDDRVLNVLSSIPRENFVPANRRDLAFTDISIPLAHNQVMMPPKLEGKLLQALTIKPDDRILEIGTGSGYVTACLAGLGQDVVSIELYEDFIDQARSKLDQHDIGNVTLKQGDAGSGWEQDSGFDAIAVTGSLPLLHEGYHRLLNPGGRLFVIVGKPPIMQALLITRVGEQEWIRESMFETMLPALVNAPGPEVFRF
jgi:protein-L-isoaspartate(D-aspartate) O-methyltransferase